MYTMEGIRAERTHLGSTAEHNLTDEMWEAKLKILHTK